MGCLVSDKRGNCQTGSEGRNLDFRRGKFKVEAGAHPTKLNRIKLEKRLQL